ncbi:MAG: PIN domain-containing protein [Nanoarchaeota archaeon]|nr:PIN domain-containing protein [Nanoarchaeota archaeon]
MNIHYYFDTSIWLDIFEKRGRNGESAERLMEKILLEDNIVVYSEMVVIELSNLCYSQEQIHMILTIAKPDHIKRVQVTKAEYRESKHIAKQRGIPAGDAIHAIIARDTESLLVSRDSDFQKLKDIARVALPEELI